MPRRFKTEAGLQLPPQPPDPIPGSALYPGFNPPSAPNALDDELTTLGLSGWTVWDVGGNFAIPPEVLNVNRGLRLECNDPGPAELQGIFKAAPAGDFTLWARVMGSSQSQNNSFVGLMVAEDLVANPATANIAVAVMLTDLANGPKCERNTLTAYNAFNFGAASASIPNTSWLRLRYVSATNAFASEYSADGILWMPAASGATTASGLAGAGSVGLCVHNNSGLSPYVGLARHFRVTPSAAFDQILPTADYE